jgi:putative cardiolipin synthase
MTRLGQQFRNINRQHTGKSGFRIIPIGTEGFLIRMQMINSAERTLDLQYYIFRADKTGRLLSDAVLHAADRGVRVRILIDDGDTVAGDEQIIALDAHPSVEIRIFNPFSYRGKIELFRATEFMFNSSRLNYRMHNKLFVVDNAIALIGGRNIADEYFQVDPESQFADDDLFTAGPIVQRLSTTFDNYWNSSLSIPVEVISGETSSLVSLNEYRESLGDQRRQFSVAGIAYVNRFGTGEPYDSIISGRLPLIWAHAQVIWDSPDKKRVEDGYTAGRLIQREVTRAVLSIRSELLMVTPFLIPGIEGMQMFEDLRNRDVRIRILTNSLESSTVLMAQSGYMSYRMPLLKEGIELYEIRSLLGNIRGSGETMAISRFGNYSLHAKMFVFDRQRVFIGSMNFDQRSLHLNTEIGLIIDSPALAEQVVKRFEAMVHPDNCYKLMLHPNNPGEAPSLVWHTREHGQIFDYETEPARSDWQRIKANVLSLLPLDDEL